MDDSSKNRDKIMQAGSPEEVEERMREKSARAVGKVSGAVERANEKLDDDGLKQKGEQAIRATGEGTRKASETLREVGSTAKDEIARTREQMRDDKTA